MKKQGQVFLKVKVLIPYQYAIQIQQIPTDVQPQVFDRPKRMDILEENSWFVNLSFSKNYCLESKIFTYKYFLANRDYPEYVLQYQEKFIDRYDRQVSVENLQENYLERYEDPTNDYKEQVIKNGEFDKISLLMRLKEQKILNDNSNNIGIQLYGQKMAAKIIEEFKNYQETVSNCKEIKSFKIYLTSNYEEYQLIKEKKRKEESKIKEEQLQKLRELQQKMREQKMREEEEKQKQHLAKVEKENKKREQEKQYYEKSKQYVKSCQLDIFNTSIQELRQLVLPQLQEINPHIYDIDDQLVKTTLCTKHCKILYKKLHKKQSSLKYSLNKRQKELKAAIPDLKKLTFQSIANKQEAKYSYSSNEVSYLYQSQIILTGQTENLSYVNLKIEHSEELSYELLEENPQKKRVSIKFCKSSLCSIWRCTYIAFQFHGQTQSDLNNSGNHLFQKYYKISVVKTETFVNNCQISPNLFNPNYNMYWGNSFKYSTDYRGGFYVQNGNQKIPNLLHGQYYFMEQSIHFVKPIAEIELKAGNANLYGGQQCRITGQTIISRYSNIYFSDDISICESYAYDSIRIGKKHVMFIFQCRVTLTMLGVQLIVLTIIQQIKNMLKVV
ncbi:hypothetical protein ABPG74_000877 [Tetrahymena malaccensis]